MLSTTAAPLLLNSTNMDTMQHRLEFLKATYEWLIPIMIIILLIAMVGNGVIVLSAPFMSSPVSPYLKLCISLAAADFWAAALLITGLVVNSYMPVVLGYRKTSMCADAWLEMFRIGGMLTSDLHLFALAINQFLGTLWPLKYKVLITTRKIRCIIVSLWLLPIIFLLSWFCASPEDGLRHETCMMYFYNAFPFRLTIFLIFMAPLIATLAIYATILAKLLKAKAEFDSSCHAERRLNSRRSNVHSKLKLVWTTLLIVSSFAFSWGLCVLYFVLVCKDGCAFEYLVDVDFYLGLFLSSSVQSLVMIKLALNPFIYTLRIKAIRKSVDSLVAAFCRRRPYTAAKHCKAAMTLVSNSSVAQHSN